MHIQSVFKELQKIRQDNVGLACKNYWKPDQAKCCQFTLSKQECHMFKHNLKLSECMLTGWNRSSKESLDVIGKQILMRLLTKNRKRRYE